MRFILIEMNQEIADRKIGAHQYSKRKKDVNYAREYASSLNFPLYNHNLSDEEALLAVNKFSDAFYSRNPKAVLRALRHN